MYYRYVDYIPRHIFWAYRSFLIYLFTARHLRWQLSDFKLPAIVKHDEHACQSRSQWRRVRTISEVNCFLRKVCVYPVTSSSSKLRFVKSEKQVHQSGQSFKENTTCFMKGRWQKDILVPREVTTLFAAISNVIIYNYVDTLNEVVKGVNLSEFHLQKCKMCPFLCYINILIYEFMWCVKQSKLSLAHVTSLS